MSDRGCSEERHKMLIAGPSKAGKSFLQIELCISIAEGKDWLGWKCARGRVMYVNLELDRASCLHRFRDVYDTLGWRPKYLDSIDIWNLRGKSVPMDKLAPKLIRRAAKKTMWLLSLIRFIRSLPEMRTVRIRWRISAISLTRFVQNWAVR